MPAVKPNADLFDNLPLRSYHTQNQNHRERIYNEQQKANEGPILGTKINDSGPGNPRLRTGGRMGPARPPYGVYDITLQAEPYDSEEAPPSTTFFEKRTCLSSLQF